jgi:transcriptional regulator with XRE-family HTH domain/predicted Fe-Mo cluster-binding NifX family protein
MNSPEITRMEEHIGNQVRRLRLSRNLTLRELAQRSGLNINTLSLIENGKTSPSVATLQQLAMALGVRITEFFESAEAEQEVVYTPAERRPQRSAGGALIQNLTARLAQDGLEAFMVHLKPGGEGMDRHISHAGWEFVFVLSGVVEYRIGEQIYELKQGDSLAFVADLPHCWHNPLEDRAAQLLLVIVPGREQGNLQRRHFTFNSQSKELTMKIALITDDGKSISRHFGRATHYLVLTLEDGKVVNRELRPKLGHRHFHGEEEGNHEHEHAETADQHHERHVSMAEAIADCAVLICGGMGRPAYESMLRLNIKPLVTDLMDVDEAVAAFLDGKLVDHTELLH